MKIVWYLNHTRPVAGCGRSKIDLTNIRLTTSFGFGKADLSLRFIDVSLLCFFQIFRVHRIHSLKRMALRLLAAIKLAE